jgi:quercetin dioxygenase-like cupin family protein
MRKRGRRMNTSATATSGLIIAGSEGEAIWFNGALMRFKVPGEWSSDAYSLMEVSSSEGRATGLHADPNNETFYVLEGELLFHVDGKEQHRAVAGDTVAIPPGTAHAFLVVSPTARFLVMNTPSYDRFFREGGLPATHGDLASAPPPDHERTLAAAQKFGCQFFGPPPFDPESVTRVSG